MILTKKKRLRLDIRQQTALLTRQEKLRQSVEVFSRLEKTEVFRRARNIGFFWSMTDEIPTQDTIQKWIKRKNVYLPIIHGEELLFGRYTEKCRMEEKEFRLLVPADPKLIDPADLDLLIVPGVAFDPAGRRLGKGKGYYDRFMSGAGIYTVGVCLDHQLIGEVPAEPHDRRVDMVISPGGIFAAIDASGSGGDGEGFVLKENGIKLCETTA